jgi:hypothetical protein
LKGAGHLSANCLSTICFVSNRQGKLSPLALPLQAQYAPVFTITALDYDKDGQTDLLLCGNINHARVKFGKYDANYGTLLKGNGKGIFSYVAPAKIRFQITGRCAVGIKYK